MASVTFHGPRTSEIALYKQAVTDLLTEYFSSGDVAEAAVSLQVRKPCLISFPFCFNLCAAFVNGQRGVVEGVVSPLVTRPHLLSGFCSTAGGHF